MGVYRPQRHVTDQIRKKKIRVKPTPPPIVNNLHLIYINGEFRVRDISSGNELAFRA